MEQARSASLIRSLRYDLRPELRDKKLSYHFIRPILKSQISVAQVQDFLVCTNIYLKTSSMQSKRRDLHQTRLRRETNEKLSFYCSKTCLSISSNLIGYFKQALKSNRLLRLSKAFSWAEKKMGFRAKNTMTCE